MPFARSQAARRDHERGRAAAASSATGREGAEDRQQRADGAERAAEEGGRVGRHRADAVHDPVVAGSKASAGVPRLREYERLVEVGEARSIDETRADRAAGRRGGLAVRRDDRARVERRRSCQASTLRPAVGLERPGHVDRRAGGCATCRSRCDWRRRFASIGTSRAAGVVSKRTGRRSRGRSCKRQMKRRPPSRRTCANGVHILRHTFCSHLAMRGAPARAIQELAGHSELGMTQRYMHLSPGGARRGDSTARRPRRRRGNIVATTGR